MIVKLFFIFISLVVVHSYILRNRIDLEDIVNDNVNYKQGNKAIDDDTIRRLLELLRYFLGDGQEIPSYTYFTNSSLAIANVTLLNATLQNTSYFDIIHTHADMDKLDFSFKIKYPEINVTGVYMVNADSDFFSLVGDGPFRIDLTNIFLGIDVQLQLKSDSTLELKNLILDYEVSRVNVSFEMLGGNKNVSDTLNDLINFAAPDVLKEYKPDIRALVNDEGQRYGGFIFGNMTVERFIDFINEFVPAVNKKLNYSNESWLKKLFAKMQQIDEP